MTSPIVHPRLGWLALGAVLLAVFGYLGWALFFMAGRSGTITGGSSALAILICAGVLGTGALAGVLMWLAFYSDRKGFDDQVTYEHLEPPEDPPVKP